MQLDTPINQGSPGASERIEQQHEQMRELEASIKSATVQGKAVADIAPAQPGTETAGARTEGNTSPGRISFDAQGICEDGKPLRPDDIARAIAAELNRRLATATSDEKVEIERQQHELAEARGRGETATREYIQGLIQKRQTEFASALEAESKGAGEKGKGGGEVLMEKGPAYALVAAAIVGIILAPKSFRPSAQRTITPVPTIIGDGSS